MMPTPFSNPSQSPQSASETVVNPAPSSSGRGRKRGPPLCTIRFRGEAVSRHRDEFPPCIIRKADSITGHRIDISRTVFDLYEDALRDHRVAPRLTDGAVRRLKEAAKYLGDAKMLEEIALRPLRVAAHRAKGTQAYPCHLEHLAQELERIHQPEAAARKRARAQMHRKQMPSAPFSVPPTPPPMPNMEDLDPNHGPNEDDLLNSLLPGTPNLDGMLASPHPVEVPSTPAHLAFAQTMRGQQASQLQRYSDNAVRHLDAVIADYGRLASIVSDSMGNSIDQAMMAETVVDLQAYWQQLCEAPEWLPGHAAMLLWHVLQVAQCGNLNALMQTSPDPAATQQAQRRLESLRTDVRKLVAMVQALQYPGARGISGSPAQQSSDTWGATPFGRS